MLQHQFVRLQPVCQIGAGKLKFFSESGLEIFCQVKGGPRIERVVIELKACIEFVKVAGKFLPKHKIRVLKAIQLKDALRWRH